MNESNEIHRDIYVGMVAEEMAQSGYYGEDVTLYGFLANGELHSFDDEQECPRPICWRWQPAQKFRA